MLVFKTLNAHKVIPRKRYEEVTRSEDSKQGFWTGQGIDETEEIYD